MRWPILSASPVSVFAAAAQRLRRRRHRRSPWAAYHFVAFLLAAVVGHATTVTPPSFSELVAEAQVIARGAVTSVSSRWVDTAHGRVIKTFVTFAVEKRIKGTPADPMTLEFLGGTVGTESIHVGGMPEFKVGETEILFVTGNGVQFCPLVRFGHGRYHVRTDPATQRRFVARDDNTPMTSVAAVQQPVDGHHVAALRGADAAMTPDEFETQVADELARQSR